MKRMWLFAPLFVLIVLAGGCDEFFPSKSELDSITLSPTNRFMKVNETQQFTATGTTVGGTSSDITSTATWTSSDNSVATVNAGLVTAKSSGNGLAGATVTVSASGISKTAVITVTNSTISSIGITPANPNVAVNGTQQLTATATFADNSTPQDVTARVTWSSNSTNATVSATGLVTGATTGTATITATAQTATASVSKSVDVTVQ